MEISLSKSLNGTFKPVYPSDFEAAKKIKAGDVYLFKCNKPRNYEFHKKYFALINMVFENQERYKNIDHLRKDLTIEAGYYDEYTDLHGTLQREAKSISFAKMEGFEFDELYNKTLDVICQYFHFDKEEIQQNIVEFF